MDVVIIGGGVIGLSSALRLARSGARVTVVERGVPGQEASAAAGGILGAQAEAEGPGPFLELCLRSRGLFPAFAAELEELSGVRVGYRASGLLRVTTDEAILRGLEARSSWQRERGLTAALLSPEELKRLEPELGPGLAGGLHFPDDAQVDNRALVQALQVAAARSGVRLRQGWVRRVLERSGRAVGVDVDGEAQGADAVVLAAGAWSGLVEGTRLATGLVRPARGQMVVLKAPVPFTRRVVFTDLGYLVPRADGRVLAGSTLEFAGYEKAVTADGLAHVLRVAVDACPGLRGAQVLDFWAGLRPFTQDHLPVLGPGPLEGLVLATGHFRNGILLAPATAELVADVVLGRKDGPSLAPFRFDRS